MKNTVIESTFSKSDVKTIMFSLSIFTMFPDERFSPVDFFKFQVVADFCTEKLSHNIESFSMEEMKIMFASLLYLQAINNSKVILNDVIKADCMNHIFIVNKLIPIFHRWFYDNGITIQ